jgi:RimJ/RimL family protein N-acetyltransferase
MPDATIRRVTPDDAAATAAYMCALRGEVASGGLDTISWRPPKSEAQQREYLAVVTSASNSAVFAAFADKEVVGLIDIVGGSHDFDRHAGMLGVSVARGWRGRGLGKQLMEAAIGEARSWPGFCRIELIVVTWNSGAIALYEALGFRIEGRKRKAVNFRGLPEDEFLMALVW